MTAQPCAPGPSRPLNAPVDISPGHVDPVGELPLELGAGSTEERARHGG